LVTAFEIDNGEPPNSLPPSFVSGPRWECLCILPFFLPKIVLSRKITHILFPFFFLQLRLMIKKKQFPPPPLCMEAKGTAHSPFFSFPLRPLPSSSSRERSRPLPPLYSAKIDDSAKIYQPSFSSILSLLLIYDRWVWLSRFLLVFLFSLELYDLQSAFRLPISSLLFYFSSGSFFFFFSLLRQLSPGLGKCPCLIFFPPGQSQLFRTYPLFFFLSDRESKIRQSYVSFPLFFPQAPVSTGTSRLPFPFFGYGRRLHNRLALFFSFFDLEAVFFFLFGRF